MKVFVSMIALFLAVGPEFLDACTLIAVGKKATKDGSVLVSHTDTGPDSRIFRVPAQTFKPGVMAAVYLDIQDASLPLRSDGRILGYIPQVEKTYAYFHSAYSHINEHQLAIGESTTSMRPELAVTHESGKQIMTIEQAMIFALQRHKDAREATAFIGDLCTRYGFLPSSGADGAEALIIADPQEAWVFEVFSVGPGWTPESGKPGAIWAAQRLPDDQAIIIPNWSTIKQIHIEDKDNFMASDNFKQEAIDRGWYDPASGMPFIWQDAYAPPPLEWATSRYWSFFHLFAPNAVKLPERMLDKDPHKGLNQYFQVVEPLALYPFSVKPQKPISPQNIMAFQRSVHEGSIYDMSEDPAWYVLDGKGGYKKSPLATPFPGNELRRLLRITNRRPVARHRGHYGMVAQLRGWLPAAIGGIYYVYLDNPYFSPYVPIYAGNLSVDPTYNTYDPQKYQENSARWAIDFVDNLARLRFQDAINDVRARRDPFEQKMFTDMAEMEQKATVLYQKNPGKARKLLTDFSNRQMREVTHMFTELRDELIVKYT
ncbi:MAG: C69 family dipeptidase, partial [Candidatus Aminicenantes bacterium]|nr:C69 family dipeptidase [Candidatus Aminicenantes bacterium]